MAQVRAETHVGGFLKEAAFKTKDGSFSSLRRFLGTWGWDASQFKRGTIENQVVRADLGYNEPGVGLASDNSTINFNCYPQGVGVVGSTLGAGDGETPVPNAFTYLLESCLGAAATIADGGTTRTTATAWTPSATSIQEEGAGIHAANGIVCIEDNRTGAEYSGRAVCRPYSTYTVGTMACLMAFPAAWVLAAAAGDVIFGGITITSAEAAAVTLQGDWLGARSSQSFEFFGAIFNFSIGEVANGEAPVFAFEGKCADFTRDIATTRTSVNSLRPTTLAGGEFLLAKYGNTTATELNVLRFGFVLGREYTRQSGQNNAGIGGWVLTDQTTELTLYVDDNASVPAGFTGTTYNALFENGDNDNQFHYFASLGCRQPGRIVNLYLPHIHMSAEPEHVNMDKIDMLKLMFRLSQGENSVRMAQH